MPNIAENLLQLGHLVQAGRVGFSLLVMNENEDITKAVAEANELIVKYATSGPQLYIKQPESMGGKIVPISSMDVGALNDILNSLLHIGVEQPPKIGKTTLWVRLMEHNGDSKANNPNVIKKFYDYYEENKANLIPYVQQIFKNGRTINVTPYVQANNVYMKVDSTSPVTNIADVLTAIIKGASATEGALKEAARIAGVDVGIIKTKIAEWFKDFITKISAVEDARGKLKEQITALTQTLNVDSLVPMLEKKLRPKKVTIPDLVPGRYLLVKFSILNNSQVITNIPEVEDMQTVANYYDHFSSPVYIERGWDEANNGWSKLSPVGNKEMLVVGSWGTPLPKNYYYKSSKSITPAIDEVENRAIFNVEKIYPEIAGTSMIHGRVNHTYIREGSEQHILDVFRFNMKSESDTADYSFYVWLKSGSVFTLWSRYIETIVYEVMMDTQGGSPTSTVIKDDIAIPCTTIMGTVGMERVHMQFVDQLYVTNEILLGNDLSLAVVD